jgi:hypothetical protein
VNPHEQATSLPGGISRKCFFMVRWHLGHVILSIPFQLLSNSRSTFGSLFFITMSPLFSNDKHQWRVAGGMELAGRRWARLSGVA